MYLKISFEYIANSIYNLFFYYHHSYINGNTATEYKWSSKFKRYLCATIFNSKSWFIFNRTKVQTIGRKFIRIWQMLTEMEMKHLILKFTLMKSSFPSNNLEGFDLMFDERKGHRNSITCLTYSKFQMKWNFSFAATVLWLIVLEKSTLSLTSFPPELLANGRLILNIGRRNADLKSFHCKRLYNMEESDQDFK